MIVLSARNISKEYGADTVLEGISFGVNAGDRVGIVGPNGAGKTTLMNILSGDEEQTSGDLYVSKDLVTGYLKQRDDFFSERTVLEEMEDIFSDLAEMEDEMLELSRMIPELSGDDQQTALERYAGLAQRFEDRGGYRYRSDIRGILSSMAFGEEYYDKKISMLSGGERTRLALVSLLLKKPDLLLLDEPTNHLDIGTLKWLGQYLASYKGTMIVVSHDRYFLNETVSRIFDIHGGRLDVYEGGYDFYAERKREIREEELRRWQRQQKEIARQEDMIRRYKQRGTEKLAKRAASREKQLEAMDRLERPEGEAGRVKIRFREKYRSGTDVLEVKGLAKSFGYGSSKKELFSGVDLELRRGEKICLVGPNGTGKTTLLRLIKGELKADEGEIKYGHNVDMAYYDQGQRLLNEDNTVIEEMKNEYRLYSDTQMRTLLGRFLFRGDDVFLPVRALSGGEKARLSLLKLMLSGANLLLLDEPTNHLDIDSKEIFEEAIIDFPGTAIIISHDRYLLSKVPTRILELDRDGLNEYLGKYDYYERKKREIGSGAGYIGSLGRGGEPAGGGKKDRDSGGGLYGSRGEAPLGAGSGTGSGGNAGADTGIGSGSGSGSGPYTGSGTATRSGTGTGTGSNTRPGAGSGTCPGTGSGGNAGADTGIGQSAGSGSRTDAYTSLGAGSESGANAGADFGTGPGPDAGADTGTGPGTGPDPGAATAEKKRPLSSAEERRLKKEKEAKERRERREKEELERKITELEIRIHEIEEEMCSGDVLSDHIRLEALKKELDENNDQLTNFYQKWLQ